MAGMEPLCQAPLILLLQPACMCRSRGDGGCTRANQPTFTALLQGRTSLLLLSSWPKAVRRPQPWQGIHPASRGRHRSFTGRRVRDPGWERGGQFTHMHVSCDVVTRWTTAVKRSEQLLATNVNSGQKPGSKELTGAAPSVRGPTVTAKDSVTSRVVSPFEGNERSGHVEGLWVSVVFCFFIKVVATVMSSHGENPCRTHDLCILCICHVSIKKSV